MNLLFRKLEKKSFEPRHVAEVGVYFPDASNIRDYTRRGVRTTLVEPHPKSIRRIEERFGEQPHVTLHPVAVYDFSGTLDLIQREASTFVGELELSPAIVNDRYAIEQKDRFTVESVTFDRIDDGSIDLISIDTEGSEWFVLKHMRSRPAVISVETHGAAYLNPYLDEIRTWMVENRYALFYKDKCDSVYVLPAKIVLSGADRCRLWFKDRMLAFRRIRKRAGF